jgi:hypothetical protein
LLSPEYWARKHQVPGADGVKLIELAVAVFPAAPLSVTGEPTALPPLAQPDALASGPHTKKLTVPVGLPPVALPLTVAESVFWPPSWIELLCGLELEVEDAWPTVKHSPLDPSLDAL